MADLTGFSALAEREGFLVAYPDGLNGGFNALMCCGAEDDVGFIQAVIKGIGKNYVSTPPASPTAATSPTGWQQSYPATSRSSRRSAAA